METFALQWRLRLDQLVRPEVEPHVRPKSRAHTQHSSLSSEANGKKAPEFNLLIRSIFAQLVEREKTDTRVAARDESWT